MPPQALLRAHQVRMMALRGPIKNGPRQQRHVSSGDVSSAREVRSSGRSAARETSRDLSGRRRATRGQSEIFFPFNSGVDMRSNAGCADAVSLSNFLFFFSPFGYGSMFRMKHPMERGSKLNVACKCLTVLNRLLIQGCT